MPNVNNLENSRLWDPRFEMGVKSGTVLQTLGAGLTIDRDMPHALFLDPGGATRIITLPDPERGLSFWIWNQADAAEDLTINAPPATTIGTISQNEGAFIMSDGVVWRIAVGTTT
jgi:hypothetical protein